MNPYQSIEIKRNQIKSAHTQRKCIAPLSKGSIIFESKLWPTSQSNKIHSVNKYLDKDKVNVKNKTKSVFLASKRQSTSPSIVRKMAFNKRYSEKAECQTDDVINPQNDEFVIKKTLSQRISKPHKVMQSQTFFNQRKDAKQFEVRESIKTQRKSHSQYSVRLKNNSCHLQTSKKTMNCLILIKNLKENFHEFIIQSNPVATVQCKKIHTHYDNEFYDKKLGNLLSSKELSSNQNIEDQNQFLKLLQKVKQESISLEKKEKKVYARPLLMSSEKREKIITKRRQPQKLIFNDQSDKGEQPQNFKKYLKRNIFQEAIDWSQQQTQIMKRINSKSSRSRKPPLACSSALKKKVQPNELPIQGWNDVNFVEPIPLEKIQQRQ